MVSTTYMRDVIAREEKADEQWLRSPAPFAERLSRGHWRRYPHLDYISDKVAQVAQRPIFLIVNVPPRHGKTQLISHWTPVWFLKKFPYKNVILCSYQAGFAAELGGDAKNTFIENQEDIGLTIQQDTKSKSRWRIKGYGGGMLAVGIGGPITGRGGNLIIIDDPVRNQKEALSATYRENIKRWYQGTLRTRLEPGGSIIIVSTRWHEDDLCGWLQNRPDDEFADPWEIINLPALAEPTEANPDPLGREEGAALWPERYDEKALANIKWGVSDDPESQQPLGTYWWDAEYQGRPHAVGGNIVQEGWFNYFNPDDFEDLKLNRYIQFWDTAHKEKQSNDRSACITMAEGKHGYYVLDLFFDRITFPDLLRQTEVQYQKWAPDSVEVEDKASGISLIQQLRRDTKIPIHAIKAIDDKLTRLNSVTPIIEAGRVWLPSRAPWLSAFLSEVCGFPTAPFDDITDCFAYGLMHYKPRRRASLGLRSMGEKQKSRWREG